MFLTIFPILLLAGQVSVLACEGDCITDITHAWLGNYTSLVNSVFQHAARQISQTLFPQGSDHDSMPHLRPIISAYDDSSYDGMKNAIFPSYFHGKCQRNGVDPPGCPNPDCPVVCGTPGSLVHFFPTLRLISFNYTRHQLQELCLPGHDAYAQAERAVIEAVAGATHRRRDDEQRGAPRNFPYVWKREERVKEGFRAIMGQIPAILEQACGGNPSEDKNALPNCSWETGMKAYILSFP